MTKKVSKISEVGSITAVAESLGRTRTALRAAIRRGVVETATLGDGETTVVSIASAKKWDASDSTPGRKKTKLV